ncbi:PREDICTED: uncharacterized protein LOC105963889 [Erythranthe guttata]|nr:PREDICTED: uncharacterized protein LOC105963889 [Erythranthe guttata]XP_012843828.1 PREDICTED: uncharacterized protein LOC105963889 [Erythranthe guttata]|eukprot:XP_012843827.1 PREDICTED: uncharacterized protein LOC105963889 [Erythranthe guttata]
MPPAAETAAPPPKWEVGPTEEVVQAFIETLVDPRLPLSVSIDDPPDEDAHRSVARQMHAVVVLYNYYHRKQKPELEFLDFVPFSKLALSLRPNLIPFMKFTNESESIEFDGNENGLSETEKSIKNACDISKALDANKDFPTIENCPVSKVAVLLIDSKRENCLLQFGSATEGVWSLIEKEVSDETLQEENNVGNKRKRKAVLDNDSQSLLQLAFDSVKAITGFDSSDLAVLEIHVTYSLSKEKSAVKFYMIECSQTFNKNQTVPLDFLVESLQGPLAEKFDGSWSTILNIIEYCQMFPYLPFISSWLPRKDLCVPILIEPFRSSVPISASSNDGIDENIGNENGEEGQKKLKHSLESSGNISTSKKGGIFANKSNKKSNNSAKRDASKTKSNIGLENRDNDSDKRSTRSLTRSISKDYNNNNTATGNHNNIDNGDSAKKGLLPNSGKKTRDAEKNGSPSGCPKVSPIISEDNSNARKEYDDVEILSDNTEAKNVQDSEYLEIALAILYHKRQQLCTQICTMEDECALYDHLIERLRNGGEVGLARKFTESIEAGKIHLLLKNENDDNCKSEKQTKLPEIFLPGQSSCEDLEYICVKNKWRLPKYSVVPSNGKFLSNVAVESNDLKLSTEGSAGSTPVEARESAAAQMIGKIKTRYCVNEI